MVIHPESVVESNEAMAPTHRSWLKHIQVIESWSVGLAATDRLHWPYSHQHLSSGRPVTRTSWLELWILVVSWMWRWRRSWFPEKIGKTATLRTLPLSCRGIVAIFSSKYDRHVDCDPAEIRKVFDSKWTWESEFRAQHTPEDQRHSSVWQPSKERHIITLLVGLDFFICLRDCSNYSIFCSIFSS